MQFVKITTSAFRRGQSAAQQAYRLDPESKPYMPLLNKAHSEFRAGYLYEYNEHIAPLAASV